jgi:hypothetical protein
MSTALLNEEKILEHVFTFIFSVFARIGLCVKNMKKCPSERVKYIREENVNLP